MSFKQLLRNGMPREALECELELPGEPLVYSFKYVMGKKARRREVSLRNLAWRPLLKTFFYPVLNSLKPVVLIVKFYVSAKVKISDKDLRSDKLPATRTHEVCEYLLAFMESLQGILINTYRQIVHIQASKFYSASPKTTVRFLAYNDFIALQSKDPIYPKSKRQRSNWTKGTLQSQLAGNEKHA